MTHFDMVTVQKDKEIVLKCPVCKRPYRTTDPESKQCPTCERLEKLLKNRN